MRLRSSQFFIATLIGLAAGGALLFAQDPPASVPVAQDELRAPGSWGQDGDLSTWSGPAVAEFAFAARRGELEVMAAGRDAGPAAVRELLALQSSDWAFMVSREIAGPYAIERFEGHREALGRALAAGAQADAGALRNLAVDATCAPFLAPI